MSYCVYMVKTTGKLAVETEASLKKEANGQKVIVECGLEDYGKAEERLIDLESQSAGRAAV